jgi:hypothetical protein
VPDFFVVAAFAIALLGVGAAVALSFRVRQLRRAEFIRTYRWPSGLFERFHSEHPALTRKDFALVSRGLRQFFIAYLMSGRKFVTMPSQVADDLWHEFILSTREYQAFCRAAFGGFFHHAPAAALAQGGKKLNAGLRRVWWYTCKYENIDPRHPTRVPLLFALDGKLKIKNGFTYVPDCRAVGRATDSRTYCGGDFGSSGIDGGTDGFGDSSSGDSSGGSDGGGGGDGGGGCGGS